MQSILNVFKWANVAAWFGDLSGLQVAYVLAIGFGGFIWITRIILAFFGGDGDADVDLDMDGTMDVGDASDTTFRLISLQGISGFLIMFGLTGMAILGVDRTKQLLSLMSATASGVAMMAIVASITTLMMRLQSSGNIPLNSAVGAEGTVYLTIPAEGAGQAQINIGNRSRLYDASSANGAEIPTGAKVKVLRIVGGDTLVVEKI